MKKDNIKQNFRKPVGRDLEIVSEDMLKEKDVTAVSYTHLIRETSNIKYWEKLKRQ